MKLFSGMCSWWHRRRQEATDSARGALVREFIYLDDISVYSILASTKGAIATEFTENQTVSLNNDVGTSIGIGLDATNARFSSGLQSSHVHGSQVLRKAIVQTSFKELYDNECKSLRLKTFSGRQAPNVTSMVDIGRRFEQLCKDGWIVDVSLLNRGDLFEAEVELEADPIFRMTSIITTLRDLIANNQGMLGRDVTENLPVVQAMAQVLDSLLVGLVPIRGRLTKYSWTAIGDREILIHESLCANLRSDSKFAAFPAYVVGVAQGNLFWKDIRRLLFSRSEYTAFCRLSVSGLANTWSPVKITEVLEGIAPQLDDAMREFSESAAKLFSMHEVDAPIVTDGEPTDYGFIIRDYAERLIAHHSACLDSHAIESTIAEVEFAKDWWRTVDGRRAVFGRATQLLDTALEKETDGEVAYRIREDVLREAGMSSTFRAEDSATRVRARSEVRESKERFLDSEIIAIYW
ncbi:MAG: hypothetical protein F4X40_01040 [Chloroflexi bacterium]|nr:hypothetical protein [Chloroflexota bacterium]